MLLSDFSTAVEAAETPPDLWQLSLDYFHTASIPMVSYHHTRPFEREAIIVADGFPEEWVCQYISEKLIQVDPIPEFAQTTTHPFLWSDIPKLAALIPEQRAYLVKLAASGIGDGLAVQVFGPNLRSGYFGLGFGHRNHRPAAEEIGEFRIACQLAHLRYCAMVASQEPDSPPLSQRERTILEWIARGKSNGVISDLLGISTHTVDTYVRRIYAKLGVSDRTTAAIRGIGSGLVKGAV